MDDNFLPNFLFGSDFDNVRLHEENKVLKHNSTSDEFPARAPAGPQVSILPRVQIRSFVFPAIW